MTRKVDGSDQGRKGNGREGGDSGYAIKELSLTLPAACHAWKAIIFPMTDHESATSVLNQGSNSCYLAACVLGCI